MLKSQVYAVEVGVEATAGTEQTTREKIYLSGRPNFDPVAGGSINVPTSGAGYGGDDFVPGAKMGTYSLPVVLNGVDAAGDVPGWGAFLRGFSHGETINAGTDVTYQSVLEGQEALTVVGNHDKNQYKFIGSIITGLDLDFSPNSMPGMTVNGMARNVSVAEIETPAQPIFKVPEAVQAGTTILTLDGESRCFSSLGLSFQATHTSPQDLVCAQADSITNIVGTLSSSVMDGGISLYDWVAKFANEFVDFSLVHGTAGGQRITLASSAVKWSGLDSNTVISDGVAKGLSMAFKKGELPTWVID